MRAVRVKVIGPEKRVRPYKKRHGPAKTMQTILLLQNVFFKMSESEHSDSESVLSR